jgi:platelet-activating factor acetylhydrolase IB subunit alpha
MELEEKIEQLENELAAGGGAKKKEVSDGIPRAPALHTFTGHRGNVTSVKFHPIFR